MARREVGGGCDDPASDCDGYYGDIKVAVVATDDRASSSRLGYTLAVVAGGDLPRGLQLPSVDIIADPHGTRWLRFDPNDDGFDFELEVRVVDLNGNVSEPSITRIADGAGGGCSTAPAGDAALVLLALAATLRRRRSC